MNSGMLTQLPDAEGDDEDLDQQRGTAEELDVGGGDCPKHGIAGDTPKRDDQAEYDPDTSGRERELDRDNCPAQQLRHRGHERTGRPSGERLAGRGRGYRDWSPARESKLPCWGRTLGYLRPYLARILSSRPSFVTVSTNWLQKAARSSLPLLMAMAMFSVVKGFRSTSLHGRVLLNEVERDHHVDHARVDLALLDREHRLGAAVVLLDLLDALDLLDRLLPGCVELDGDDLALEVIGTLDGRVVLLRRRSPGRPRSTVSRRSSPSCGLR